MPIKNFWQYGGNKAAKDDLVDYPLKWLLPLGLLAVELLKCDGAGRANRRTAWQLAELYGAENAGRRLKLHQAAKAAHMTAGAALSAFLGLAAAQRDAAFLLFCLVLTGGLYLLPDYELQKKVKQRRFLLQADFPGFLNRITLLLGAGMTITGAWEKIAKETHKNTPLYRELRRSLVEIEAGKPHLRAYEDFAQRCRIPEINRFVSAVVRNIRKGNAELVLILSAQGSDCWEMRKHTARRLGEEASTRMLFPLALMLIAIMLIVSTPAVLAIRGF
ncbi:MAG: type II secretion system F family protein [Peptococcaceae bacterium]|jgi:tight adherence protein C|nr:type II secretion system F family protein [Peptococcaceae bacterium]MDH7525093.1 type II secretion system F family protein [Peptococcaceae bacterium]